MNTYPRDEFDAVPEAPRRQGVHRTRGEDGADGGTSSGRGLRWILAAGILALVIGAVSFFVLPRLGLSGEAAAASATSAPAASAAASSPAAGASSAAPSQAPSSTAPTSAPTPSAARADKSLEVGVYNATTTAGLGTRVATAARTSGWSVSTVANWSGSPVAGPVIYYRSAGDAASAKALAADVGIPTVLEAPALGIPLAVVIGPGYTG